MKREKMFDGITDIREDLVVQAGKTNRRKPWWPAAVAAVLAAAIVSGIALWAWRGPGDSADPAVSPPSSALSPYALAVAQYPEMVPYPKYEDYLRNDGTLDDGYFDAYNAWRESRNALASDVEWSGVLDQYLTAAAEEFLTGAETENRVFSPLNVYMALAMLAETTDGNSRQQILDLLGVDSIEALRSQASELWRSSYRDDGLVTSILASSLWLNQDVQFQQSTLDTLAEIYYASTFQGEMGSEELNQALRDWLNEQTGGLLADQAQGLEMDPDTVLAIAATLYFKASWHNEFSKSATAPDVFHAPDGDLTCDFMHQSGSDNYYWGNHFSSVRLSLNDRGFMWFLLPDEGTSPDQLLESGEAMEFLLADKWGTGEHAQVWENQKYLTVNLSLPKFDVSSDLDLVGGLQNLGITDVFHSDVSNFTPLTSREELYVSQAQHAARVVIDEEGCTAAAYTVLMITESAAIDQADEIDFVLDQPFLFAITNDDGLPLFVGVVNQPVS